MPQPAVFIATITTPITVVAVHGNGGGAFRFAMVADRMPRRIRFVTPDLPGFGRAGRTTPLPSMRAYAEWLAEIVAATPAPRVLLGHGIGGAFVLELLQHHRELVQGIILHAPVGVRLASRRFPRLMKPRPVRWMVQRALASPLFRPVWRRRFFRRPIPRRVERRFFANYGQCAAFGAMFDLITPQWFDTLRPVNLPAALLWGGRERVLPASHAPEYRRILPQASVVIEPEWDHFPMLDAPRAYAMRIAALAQTLA